MPTFAGCQERTGANWDHPKQTGTHCNSFYRSLKGRKLENGSSLIQLKIELKILFHLNIDTKTVKVIYSERRDFYTVKPIIIC